MELELEENVTPTEVRVVWTESAVKSLLAFYSANMHNVGKTFALKNQTKLWKKGAEVLAAEGFEFSPAQVETKFRSLKRQYKKSLLNNKSTGRNRISCPYQEELDDIFQKEEGLNIENTLDAEGIEADVSLQFQNSDCSMQSSNSQAVSHVLQDDTKKCKKSSVQDSIVRVLEQMAEDRRKEHNELMAFLKQKEQNRERRAKDREKLLLILNILKND